MSFGSRIKQRRKQLGMTQSQLAEILGVTAGAVANYETDVSLPKATILYRVFDALKCDANYLFQDKINYIYSDNATPDEMEKLVKRYRSLSEHGKIIVDYILESEYLHTADIPPGYEMLNETEKAQVIDSIAVLKNNPRYSRN